MKAVRVKLEYVIRSRSSAHVYGTTPLSLKCESVYVFEDGRGFEHGQFYGHPGILALEKRGVLKAGLEISDNSRVSYAIYELQMLLGKMTVHEDPPAAFDPMKGIGYSFISLEINGVNRSFNVCDLEDFEEALLYVHDSIKEMWVLNLKSEPLASTVADRPSNGPVVFREKPSATTAQQEPSATTAEEMPLFAMNPQIPPNAAVQAMDAELQDLNASSDCAGAPRPPR